MNGSCPRKLTITSCSNHCSCGGGDCESNTDNLSIKATSNSQNDMDISTNISTTQDTLITNDPVMNEFMNIDMGSNYLNHSNSNPTLSTTTAAVATTLSTTSTPTPTLTPTPTTITPITNITTSNNNISGNSKNNINSKSNDFILNTTNSNTNSIHTKINSNTNNNNNTNINSNTNKNNINNSNNIINLQQPLSTDNIHSFLSYTSSPLNQLHNRNIMNNLKTNVSPLNSNIVPSANLNSTIAKVQLQQLQQTLKQKIMNQNKTNNLPQLPINDIRNELSEDLLLSILNAE